LLHEYSHLKVCAPQIVSTSGESTLILCMSHSLSIFQASSPVDPIVIHVTLSRYLQEPRKKPTCTKSTIYVTSWMPVSQSSGYLQIQHRSHPFHYSRLKQHGQHFRSSNVVIPWRNSGQNDHASGLGCHQRLILQRVKSGWIHFSWSGRERMDGFFNAAYWAAFNT
jgi:hypothetical protein